MPASDYFIDIGNPFAKSMAAFREAYGDVERLRQFGEQRQEGQRVAQERQGGMDALQNLVSLGHSATSGDYMSALAANPAFGQQIGAMQKTFGAERSANELRFGQQLFSVLSGGDDDLVRQLLDERIAAYRNAGDNRAADSAQSIRLMLDKPGGLGAARTSVGMMLADGMGAQDFEAFFKQFYPQQKEMTAETRGRLEQLKLTGIDPTSPEGSRFLLTGSLGDQFRPATPEEAARYGASAGQIDDKTGRFYPIAPPTGMTIEQTPGGGFRVVQGPGAGPPAAGRTPGYVYGTDDQGVPVASPIPGTPAAAEVQAERGRLEAVIGVGQDMLQTIERVVGRPAGDGQAGLPPAEALSGILGLIKGQLPPRTQAQADLMAQVEQITGRAFLEAFDTLKGGGQITELEGQRATQAIARLQRTQSPEAFQEAMFEFAAIVRRGIERSRNELRILPEVAPATPGGRIRYDAEGNRLK